jgi:hypothetical protein
MDFIYNKSLSIPQEIRKDVQKAIEDNRGCIYYNHLDLQFLFNVWNRYIARPDEPEDITCSACKTLVIGKLKLYVEAWEEHGFEDKEAS